MSFTSEIAEGWDHSRTCKGMQGPDLEIGFRDAKWAELRTRRAAETTASLTVGATVEAVPLSDQQIALLDRVRPTLPDVEVYAGR